MGGTDNQGCGAFVGQVCVGTILIGFGYFLAKFSENASLDWIGLAMMVLGVFAAFANLQKKKD